jgi:hypothetical protein
MATAKQKTKTKPKSLADVLHDWQELLAASADNAADLAAAEPQRQAVEEHLKTARELRARQESHRASRQQLTKEIKQLIADGQEAARRLRSGVKANIGTKTERLTQFKIAPIRPRGGKSKAPQVNPPEGTSTPEPPVVKAAEPATEGDQQ